MTPLTPLKSWAVSQFREPRGPAGRLAGRIMARRPSNRFRNAQIVALMALTPEARVVEFGCGPGLALEAAARIAARGRVIGLDHSAEMLAMAEARLEAAALSRRVALIRGGEAELETLPAGAFDRVFSANVTQFLADPARHAQALFRLLDAGGGCFLGFQPRLSPDAGAAAERWARRWSEALLAAGFPRVERHGFGAPEECGICLAARRPTG